MSAGTVVAGMKEDDEIEREIKAKGLTAPRVTPQRVEEVIASEYYFTAMQGVEGSFGGAASLANARIADEARQPHSALDLLTICVLVLKNGFTLLGKGACASPENFNAEVGRKVARIDAVNQIWTLEGYLLRQQLDEFQRGIVPGSGE